MRVDHRIPVLDRGAWLRTAVAVLTVLSTVGCRSSTDSPGDESPTVANVIPLSGDHQVGAAWTELPERLRLRVTDVAGDPIEGVPVRFSVITGRGGFSDALAITDADGVAESEPWTLGPLSGEQRAEATAGGIFVYFSASASPPVLGPALPGRIAFVSDRDGNAEIYSVQADGSGLRRLTDNAWADTSPAWSHDGTQIAFAGDQDAGFDFFTIYTMTPEGSNIVRQIGGFGLSPTWSPDGSTIAYSTQPGHQIALVGLPAGQPTLVTDTGSNLRPSWSPDGLRLAFAKESGEEGYAVFTSQADGSDAVQRFPFGLNPAWSPDGSTIAYLNPSGNLISLISPEGVFQRFLVWVGDRRPNDYDAATSPHGSFAWSPDGSGIAYTFVDCDQESPVGCSDDAAVSVDYVSVDGSQHSRLIENGHSPAWRP